MQSSDVMRLGLILAVQAEIEGMKITNSERDMPSEAAAYSQEHFDGKAEELRNIAYSHEQQL